MTDETLRQLLARVHERLSSSNAVDPEAREMLATVMRDIDGALGKSASVSASEVASERGVSIERSGALSSAANPSSGSALSSGSTTTLGAVPVVTPVAVAAVPAAPAVPAGGLASAPPVRTPASDTVSAVSVSPEARVSTTAPRIEELAVRFEAEHPSIAQLLRQIGTLLGQAGI